jgi:hypothetical protein
MDTHFESAIPCLFKALSEIMECRKNRDPMTSRLQQQRRIDDKPFGSTKTKIRMQNCDT